MSDRSEQFKGGVHFVTGCLAAAMGLYNAGEALSERRQLRHVVNAAIYALAVGWEFVNTAHHLGKRHAA